MKKAAMALTIVLTLTAVPRIYAQEKSWSLETSLTFPVVNIYMLQAAFPLRERGSLLIGACYQNWKDMGEEAMGRAHAYTLMLGYRHVIWKRLSLEAELFPAYNNFKSSIDNKTYSGFETWVEYRIGYTINLGKRFYLLPQPTLGHALYLQELWPGMSRDSYVRNSLMFIPQIVVGLRL